MTSTFAFSCLCLADPMGKKRRRSKSEESEEDSTDSSSESSEDERVRKRVKKEKKGKKDKKDKKDKKGKKKKNKEKEKEKREKKEKRSKEDERFFKEQAKREKMEGKELLAHMERDRELIQLRENMSSKPRAQQPPSYLTMQDYYIKNTELMTFCAERTGRCLQDLEPAECKKEFFKFAKMWNQNKLPPKFYAGISSTNMEPAARTRYKWSFVDKLDPMELASARDTVDTDTNEKNFYDQPREFRARREGAEETPRDRERRERNEMYERQREEEDPFEQRRRWESQAKEKQSAPREYH
uniref:Uncharacterized protein n=1 Tax=Eutreptiella gymnastica TaxID=73025 RepID=A0A7S1IN72_9EUGL